MKTKDLKDIIDRYARHLDDEVRVVLDQPGMPANPTVGVKSATFGFDWNAGQLLLRTEEPIVRKPKTKKQRRDEWEKEHTRLIERVTKGTRVIASSMRLLAEIKKHAVLSTDLQEAIEKHETQVRNRNK